MVFSQAEKLLQQSGQEHVLQFWEELAPGERRALLAQIATLDFAELRRMQQLLAVSEKHEGAIPKPASVFKWQSQAELSAALAVGESVLADGKVAVVLVAGGQGSRLGYDGPKGGYGIGPLTNAPLFYFHARKILRLSRLYGKSLPLFIMTSAVNHAATLAVFEEHDYFGLQAGDVFFFQQGVLPALDSQGRIFMAEKSRIFMSPDGHGGTLGALKQSGSFNKMRRRGVEHVFYFQVDNPLVDVADPAFVGLHVMQEAEMSLKLCLKSTPDEKMGVVAQEADGSCRLIEYSEMSSEQAAKFKYGSPAIHLFSLDFLLREARRKLPLHLAWKKIDHLSDKGKRVVPGEPNGYKFEKFIFDVLPHAAQVLNLAFERADEFSPVKNAVGNDSPETCRQALQTKWRKWLKQAGITVPVDIPVEIDPAYVNSSNELRTGLRLG